MALAPKRTYRPGTTLVELVVASLVMLVVMGAVLPLVANARRHWEAARNNTDVLQNGRILTAHLQMHLSQATRITSVSPVGQTLGSIEFEDADGDTLRYDVTNDNQVQYGLVASQSELAGPVTQFRFTCYAGDDLNTPITDVSDIRFIKIVSTVNSTSDATKQKTFPTSVYLHVNGNNLTETTMGTPFEFNTSLGKEPALAAIDSTHTLCAYEGDGDDGWATILAVNPSTWAITQGTPFEFDTVKGKTPALALIDASQYLCAYSGDGDDGWATILTVDTDTWTVTQGTPFEFDANKGQTPALVQIDDDHYLCAYTGDDDGWAVVLTPGNGLVAHWKLDEASGTTAADASGNGHTGFLINMAGNEWTTGTVEGALAFSGYNDYIGVRHADDFLIDNGTVALWFKADDVSNRGELFSKDSSGYDTGGHLTIYVENSKLEVRLQSTGSSYEVDSDATLQDDTWYHAALSWGSEGMTLYLDGSEVDTDAYAGGLGTTSGGTGNYEPLALGACTWVSGNLTLTPIQYYFDGIIDDVRVYNQALDAAEITALAETLGCQEFTEAKVETETSSITLDTPGSTSTGDLLITAVATDGSTDDSLTPPVGENWTEINTNTNTNGNAVTLGTWWKLAEVSESATHQFTWSGAQQAYAWMMRFSGHDTTDPIDISVAANSTSSSPTSPAVISTVDNALILRLGAFDDRDISVDSPGLAGHTAITMDSSTANSGLVAQWKFDESSGTTATDASGNGHDGTLTNMSGSEWTTGTLNGALRFDGSNDRVSCGNFDVTGGDGHITLCAWMKADDFGTSDARFLAKTTSTAEQSHYWMLSTYSGTRLRFRLKTNGSTTTLYSDSGVLSTGVWTHVAATWDGSTMRVYANGTERKSTSKSGTLSTSSSVEIAIGNNPPGAGEVPFDGLIDDVRIYNQALNSVELADVAAGSGGGPPVSSGIVSGAAGFVIQTSSGSSGTSSFALTASEEARLVTLAIAPSTQTSSDAVSTITKSAAYEFDSSKGKTPTLVQIDSTHYLCAYSGDGDDGWAVVLTVNTGNWTISKGTPFEFDSSKGMRPALAQIDGTHYLCTYTSDEDDGWVTVLTVNTSTWTLSQGTPFEFEQGKGMEPALVGMGSDNFLCAYRGDGDDGYSMVLIVDTDTWTISHQSFAFEFDTNTGKTPALTQIDTDHYLCAYAGNDDDGWSVVLMPSTTGIAP